MFFGRSVPGGFNILPYPSVSAIIALPVDCGTRSVYLRTTVSYPPVMREETGGFVASLARRGAVAEAGNRPRTFLSNVDYSAGMWRSHPRPEFRDSVAMDACRVAQGFAGGTWCHVFHKETTGKEK